MELTPKKRVAAEAFYQSKSCRIYNTPMRLVIIPLTFYKEMTNPFIKEIFSKADKILREAVDYLYVVIRLQMIIYRKYMLKRTERF